MQSRIIMVFLTHSSNANVRSYGHHVVFPKIFTVTRDDFISFFFCSEPVILTFYALLLLYALYFLILEFLTQSIQAALFSQRSLNTLMDYG